MRHRFQVWALWVLGGLLIGVGCQTAAPTLDESAVVAAVMATLEAQTPIEIGIPDPTAVAAIANPAATPIPAIVASAPDMVEGLQERLVELYQQVNPSVVFILVNQTGFELGSGSGFVYDDQGHIVTNAHVVADGDSYEVVLWDGERHSASLLGRDVDSDLAVLQLIDPPADLQPLPLGTVDEVQVGQFVIAIGNPFGEQGSMSLGIVSGLGRSLASQRITDFGGSYRLPRVIQTDAPINPGNSGGPLLNLAGEVVGVNSAIRTDTGVNSGVGFSIPVDAVRRVAPSLIANGRHVYPFMGISVLSPEDISLTERESLGLDDQEGGVYVTVVTPDSPADRAGVVSAASGQTGDLIIRLNGKDIHDFDDLNSFLVFEAEVGQVVAVTVLRNGMEVELNLTLGERP